MIRKLTALGLLSLAISTLSTQAITLTFEDLSGAGALPANYSGLTWNNFLYYDAPQSPYVPSSGVERIYNDRPLAGSVLFPSDVTFNSLWFAGYAYGQYIEGYNNGILVYTSAAQASDGSDFGQTLNLNWVGVDEIRVIASGSPENNHYIVDDFTYTATAAAVPEAGTTFMFLGAAICALGLARRRLV